MEPKQQALLAAVAALLLNACAGSIITGPFLEGGATVFDFRVPACGEQPVVHSVLTDIEVRHLGSGGVFIGWGADALLMGPYFSRVGGPLAAALGRVRFDRDRIAHGMRDLDRSRVRAIVLGHSHFDHIGDVPIVAREWVPAVPIFTNDSGVHLLSPYRDVAERARSVEKATGWIDVPGSSLRILPLPSQHAPQTCRGHRWPCTYARCETLAPAAREWEHLPLRKLCDGRSFAFVIDLLDANRAVRFRIYYNDAAAPEGAGAPPQDLVPPHAYDLAILCMASYDLVERYPEWIIGEMKPRHVLLSHFEDFFARESPGRWTFAPRLTNSKAARFIERLEEALSAIPKPMPPASDVCGPSTDRWSMPTPDPSRAIIFRPSTEGSP